jgi:hypothetical protein
MHALQASSAHVMRARDATALAAHSKPRSAQPMEYRVTVPLAGS